MGNLDSCGGIQRQTTRRNSRVRHAERRAENVYVRDLNHVCEPRKCLCLDYWTPERLDSIELSKAPSVLRICCPIDTFCGSSSHHIFWCDSNTELAAGASFLSSEDTNSIFGAIDSWLVRCAVFSELGLRCASSLKEEKEGEQREVITSAK